MPTALSAQPNLVPNPGFDILSSCPIPATWQAYQNTPDRFNTCNGSVPNSWAGNQAAHSGTGYVAIVNRHATALYHEFTGIALTTPLTVGETYCVEFFISLTELSQWGANNMGVQFNTAPSAAMNGNSQVFGTAVVTDKTNWTQISGSFVATQAYTHVAVGNFFTDAATTIAPAVGGSYSGAYYFIESVSCSVCTILDGQWEFATLENRNGNIKLNWQFAGVDVATFGIERSYDSEQWEQIDELIGNNAVQQFYDLPSFTEEVFYRIRATDMNGKTHLSRIVSARLDEDGDDIFSVYPVPATVGDDLKVALHLGASETGLLRVIDVQGREIFTTPLSGADPTEIPTEGFRAGLYFFQVQAGARREVSSVVLH